VVKAVVQVGDSGDHQKIVLAQRCEARGYDSTDQWCLEQAIKGAIPSITLDMSTAKPIGAAKPVTLDMSTAEPVR
jgi:hypothetical protein